jgi:2-haloacid dehalogenase
VRAEALFPGAGERLAQLWRDKQIEYTRLVTMSGRYRPFNDLTQRALQFACARLRLELTPAAREALMGEYERLRPFGENETVLRELKQRGVRAGVLSNGDPPMLEAVIAHAGFASLLDPVLSVHSVQRFKTDPASYALGPEALQLAARDILFVSSNAWDAIGATWYGYTTLWVNRAGAPLDPLDTAPTRSGADLRTVLDFFPN